MVKRRERRAPIPERDLQVASAWEGSKSLENREAVDCGALKRRERRAPVSERDLQVASTCEGSESLENREAVGSRAVKRLEHSDANYSFNKPCFLG